MTALRWVVGLLVVLSLMVILRRRKPPK